MWPQEAAMTKGYKQLVAETLRDMGMDSVAHLGGGFKAWIAANGPVQRQ
jgi:rhodanese-related sulfurtransferase